MKTSWYRSYATGVPTIVALSFLAIANLLAQQQARSPLEGPEAMERARRQEKLQQVINEKASYAASIVRRWETDARAGGRWDENYASDLQKALMTLLPENPLAAGEAPSYDQMMRVLMTGQPGVSGRIVAPELASQGNLPQALGDTADDLVFTPLTPCRIVDTRNAGELFPATAPAPLTWTAPVLSRKAGSTPVAAFHSLLPEPSQ